MHSCYCGQGIIRREGDVVRSITKKILETAIEKLELCARAVSSIAEDELESAEKLPGNLKTSDKYDKMKMSAENLKCAAEQINYAIECIDIACN